MLALMLQENATDPVRVARVNKQFRYRFDADLQREDALFRAQWAADQVRPQAEQPAPRQLHGQQHPHPHGQQHPHPHGQQHPHPHGQQQGHPQREGVRHWKSMWHAEMKLSYASLKHLPGMEEIEAVELFWSGMLDTELAALGRDRLIRRPAHEHTLAGARQEVSAAQQEEAAAGAGAPEGACFSGTPAASCRRTACSAGTGLEQEDLPSRQRRCCR
jgi:hypothetical protein